MKIVKGYVSSQKINDSFIPQKLQNLVIRDYCNKNKLNLNLSATEYAGSDLILNSMHEEIQDINGIVFFSIFQLPESNNLRLKIYNKIIKKHKQLFFALENIIFKSKKNINEIENIYNINSIKKFELNVDLINNVKNL